MLLVTLTEVERFKLVPAKGNNAAALAAPGWQPAPLIFVASSDVALGGEVAPRSTAHGYTPAWRYGRNIV